MADSLFYEKLDIYMKIFLIVYADYTLLCPESLDGMQSMLDEISNLNTNLCIMIT
jgi:alkyl hydroperoxide reductase subunit AhpC